FRDKNRVVAGVLRGMEAAFQVCQRSLQYRSPMASPVEGRPGFGEGLGRAIWVGIVLGNGCLVFRQHIHSEALLSLQMGVSLRLMIHANQHQLWLQRNRGKGVGRHPVNLASVVQSNDGDPGGKTAHRLAEFSLGSAHVLQRCNTTDASKGKPALMYHFDYLEGK